MSYIDLSIFEPYKINCEKCCGLCCVALYFTKSDGFPSDKKAGTACKNLLGNFKCKAYSQLSQSGLRGCATYDCFGAGQIITSHLPSSHSWHALLPKETDLIINTYLDVLSVQQTLWYFSQCLFLELPPLEKKLAKSFLCDGNQLIENPFDTQFSQNTRLFCKESGDYLKHICTTYLAAANDTDKIYARNYMGKNMQRKNLERKNFSMCLLIAANLSQANLNGANFLGADMRDTNISNTDLRESLFLTQIQINSAKGNENTLLPPYLQKPKSWNSGK